MISQKFFGRLISKSLLLATLSLVACKQNSDHSELSAIQVRGNNLGQLRGPAVIQAMIGQRLGATGADFNLFLYARKNEPYASLAPILGSFNGNGIKNTFANGAPNSINMYLWEKVFTHLGQALASDTCGSPLTKRSAEDILNSEVGQPFPLSSYVKQSLASCAKEQQAPDRSNPFGVDPKNLWQILLEEDAPETEFTAWSRWIESPAFLAAYKTPRERLGAAIAGAWMSPYFLLEN